MSFNYLQKQNTMKRFYATIILLLLCCTTTFAQDEQPSWKSQRPRHELQFGMGDPYEFQRQHFDIPFHSFPGDVNWFGPEEYLKTQFFTPTISATYHYRLLKWLCLGGYMSYTGVFSEMVHFPSERTPLNQDHFITIAPSARVSFLNKKYVNLYAGVALGITYQISSVNPSIGKHFTSHGFHLSGQITAIGVSVGKKWFGYTEVGYGSKGIVSAGFGFRFGNNEQ